MARRASVATALAVAVTATSAGAATIFVANNGSDDGGCGSESSPCRTITQGVAAASAGDRLMVLPGVYGDVDGDGAFTSPGDEPAPDADTCSCVINVTKPLTIVSQSGAGATILRGAINGLFAVNLEGAGSVFGKKKKGFSVIGDIQHDGYGVRVGSAASGARVEGNVFSRLDNALFVAGNRAVITGNRISQITGQGIHAEGQGAQIVANVVEETGTPGGNDSAIHVVGTGGAGHKIQRNLVVANLGIGIYVDNGRSGTGSQTHLVQDNLVVGNADAGIKVVLAEDSGGATVTGNTIYNNDGASGSNCGLMTLSAGPEIQATNNYWGGAGGPGPDPKDDVCSVGTPPNSTAPASAEFAIVAPPMR